MGYSPLTYDPRPGTFNLPTQSELDADLDAIKMAFDGFNLYSYVEEFTPGLIQSAVTKGFRGVLLGIFDPRNEFEMNGVVDLIMTHSSSIAMSVCIGSEGLFGPHAFYSFHDLGAAYTRLNHKLPANKRVPITTTEPVFAYQFTCSFTDGNVTLQGMRHFGDYLAPNIHPVFVQSDQTAQFSVDFTRNTARDIMDGGDKIVYVKETGFPHDGTVSLTTYTEAVQQEYWQKYRSPGLRLDSLVHADRFTSFCSSFEAFDLEWKRVSPTGVEAHWGFMDEQRVGYDAYDDLTP